MLSAIVQMVTEGDRGTVLCHEAMVNNYAAGPAARTSPRIPSQFAQGAGAPPGVTRSYDHDRELSTCHMTMAEAVPLSHLSHIYEK